MDQPIFRIRNAEGILSDLETALKPGPPGRVVVPDVVDLMIQEASLRAGRLGLKVRTVVLTPNPAPVEGKVVRQDPQPGTEGAARPHGDFVPRISAAGGGVGPLTSA